MPIYEYRPISGACEHCHGRFDAWQKLAEPALAACPKCGQPCERLISAPNVAMGGSHVLKEKHFSEKGFTQYRKTEKGQYEKTAGPGPDKISSDGE
jgi:putative FmdB family regulatory protein